MIVRTMREKYERKTPSQAAQSFWAIQTIYIYTHIYIYKIYISFFLTFLKFNFIFIFAQQEISIVPFARSLVRRSFVLSVLLCSELTKQNVHTNHSIVCFFFIANSFRRFHEQSSDNCLSTKIDRKYIRNFRNESNDTIKWSITLYVDRNIHKIMKKEK